MSIFTINGREANTLEEAINVCREEWVKAKEVAVLEQKKDALAKPTDIDRQRAELGVVADMGRVTLG